MLVVTGPDLVGKTTFARALVKRLNSNGWPHVYQHMTRLPECWQNDALANYRRLMSPFVVMDRFHMDEPIYSLARGEGAMIGPTTYRQIDRELLCHAGFVCVVAADPELIRERYEARAAQEMYSLEKVLEVNQQYLDMLSGGFRWSGYDMRVDWSFVATRERPFPTVEDLALRAYMTRLAQVFPYPGGLVA